jgi:hypothetical protein
MTGRIGNALKLGGSGAKEVARFGGEVGGAMMDNIRVLGGAATNAALALDWTHRSRIGDEDNRRGRPRSTGGRAQRTPAIPPEAQQVFDISTPRQPRPRTPTPVRTPSDVQEGITTGSSSGLHRESRMGDNVKTAARAIIAAGRPLHGRR